MTIKPPLENMAKAGWPEFWSLDGRVDAEHRARQQADLDKRLRTAVKALLDGLSDEMLFDVAARGYATFKYRSNKAGCAEAMREDLRRALLGEKTT